MRMPLSPMGRRFMGLVYFTIPIVLGYCIMDYANSQALKNIGKRGENIESSSESIQKATLAQKAALQKVLDDIKEKKKWEN